MVEDIVLRGSNTVVLPTIVAEGCNGVEEGRVCICVMDDVDVVGVGCLMVMLAGLEGAACCR